MAIAELKQNFSSKIRRAAVTDLQIVKPSSLCVDKDMMTSSQKRPTTVKKKNKKVVKNSINSMFISRVLFNNFEATLLDQKSENRNNIYFFLNFV